MDEPLDLVRAGIPKINDCPVLTRLSAFLVDQGITATLEHVVRDRIGNPRDLTSVLLPGQSESFPSLGNSVSGSGTSVSGPCDSADGSVRLRVKEWLGFGSSSHVNPIWTIPGWSLDPAKGVVRATLLPGIVEHAGIYELSWAISDPNGRPVAVSTALLSVERTLWATQPQTIYNNLGPVTIGELRMEIMDSSRNENTLLDDVEFSDAQLLRAILEPIRLWNETPPPIDIFTTRNFPFRGAWLSGTTGQLHLVAAAHYRRNYLASEGGGLKIEDKNKEREYMAEGQRLGGEYKTWLYDKKVSINAGYFVGASVSPYLTHTGW